MEGSATHSDRAQMHFISPISSGPLDLFFILELTFSKFHTGTFATIKELGNFIVIFSYYSSGQMRGKASCIQHHQVEVAVLPLAFVTTTTKHRRFSNPCTLALGFSPHRLITGKKSSVCIIQRTGVSYNFGKTLIILER